MATLWDWLATAAGILQLSQLPSMSIARRVLAREGRFDHFDTFTRQTLTLFSAGIVACVVGLAVVVMSSHAQLLHERTGRVLCCFLTVFWLLRGLAQWTVLARSWPSSLRAMHVALCGLYPLLGLMYGAAAYAGA